jgi:hypothetical protein
VASHPHYAFGISLVDDCLVHTITTDAEIKIEICLESVESHLPGKSSKRDVTVNYILLM